MFLCLLATHTEIKSISPILPQFYFSCLVHILDSCKPQRWHLKHNRVHITWKHNIKLNTNSSAFMFILSSHQTTWPQIICIWRKCWDLPGTWCTPDAPEPCSTPSAHPQTCYQHRGQPGSPSDGHTGPRESERSGVTAVHLLEA